MNIEDMDYYEYEESKKRFTLGKIIKFIFKFIAGVIIIGTFALIFGRSALMNIPKAYKGFTWTEAAVAAQNDGKLDLLLHTPYESYDDDGAFHISDVCLSEATGEVQFTVRYNSRSTVNLLMERYGLAERPKGEVFVFVLTDNNQNTYTDYIFSAASNPLYEFRRVVFTDVELDGIYLTDEEQKYMDTLSSTEDAEIPEPETSTFYLNIYYGEDVSNNTLMSYSYVVYDYRYGSLEKQYSESDKTKLSFADAPYYVSRLADNNAD